MMMGRDYHACVDMTIMAHDEVVIVCSDQLDATRNGAIDSTHRTIATGLVEHGSCL
jgi:hypothetical protein